MPRYDLIVRGGRVLAGDRLIDADVAIDAGAIVALEPDLAGDAAAEIEARGLHVLPGLIDAHVHFNEPGRTAWEGWATGSAALAAGGGTTCLEMPLNAFPPTIDGVAFDAKLAAASATSHTDFALWGGLVPGDLDRLDDLAARGVIGFKAFMSRSGTPDFEAADDLTLYLGMERAAALGMIVAVHAENDALTSGLAQQAIAAGRTEARDYLSSRPVVAELDAISRAILFAEATGCALHIVHVSSGRGVTLVAEAQARGVNVTCETCAHYLFLTGEDVERLGAVAKCAPPLRDAAERDALWQHLGAGRIDFVTSDHSPAPPSMKESADFFQIWGGISGVQSTLPILLTGGVHQRRLPLSQIGALLASSVARRFDLLRKGTIAPGQDADLTLVALDDEFVLEHGDLHDRHRQSPYLGHRFRGRITRTILRGMTIMQDGSITGRPAGQLVRRSSAH